MRFAGLAIVVSAATGCLSPSYEKPAEADAGVEPGLPDAAPVSDAAPLTEGVTALAGGETPGDDDGPRNVARFNNPVNVAVGPGGDLYVADFDNNLVRHVTPVGTVTTLIDRNDFKRPFGLAFDGDTLYVQTDDNDRGGHSLDTGTIWRVDIDTGDAEVVARDVGRPRGIAVLPDGRLALADMAHHTVSLLDPDTGAVTLLAGAADQPGFVDATGADARFGRPYDVVVTPAGDLLVADFDNHRIRRVTVGGVVTTLAGTGDQGVKDGMLAEARFDAPQALAIDAAGNVYVTDTAGYRVRRIDTAGAVVTIAGDGEAGFRDGEPMQARFYGLEGHDVTPEGSYLYIADGNRGDGELYHRIRRLTLD